MLGVGSCSLDWCASDDGYAHEMSGRQEQRTAASRGKILNAAVEVLAEKGYAATSTVEIQKRAEVSRGRLLHHFGIRDTMLVAAAQHLASTRLAELSEDGGLPDVPPWSAERIDQAIDRLWATFQQSYFWAATELWIAARHNAPLAAALRPEEHHLHRRARDLVDRMFGPVYTASPHYPMLREILLTSMRGVAVTYAFDPRDPHSDTHVAHWKQMTHALLGAPG